jgi:hypothetical protein
MAVLATIIHHPSTINSVIEVGAATVDLTINHQPSTINSGGIDGS